MNTAFLPDPILADSVLPESIMVLVFALAIVAITMYFKDREKQRWHETTRQAIERGAPIPEYPASPDRSLSPASLHKQHMGLVIGGLVNLAAGIGLYLMFAQMPGGNQMRFVGAIPALVGVALIIAFFVSRATAPKESDNGSAGA